MSEMNELNPLLMEIRVQVLDAGGSLKPIEASRFYDRESGPGVIEANLTELVAAVRAALNRAQVYGLSREQNDPEDGFERLWNDVNTKLRTRAALESSWADPTNLHPTDEELRDSEELADRAPFGFRPPKATCTRTVGPGTAKCGTMRPWGEPCPNEANHSRSEIGVEHIFLNTPAPHAYGRPDTGGLCGVMVMRVGGGDQCGLPKDDLVHRTPLDGTPE